MRNIIPATMTNVFKTSAQASGNRSDATVCGPLEAIPSQTILKIADIRGRRYKPRRAQASVPVIAKAPEVHFYLSLN